MDKKDIIEGNIIICIKDFKRISTCYMKSNQYIIDYISPIGDILLEKRIGGVLQLIDTENILKYFEHRTNRIRRLAKGFV